MKEVQVKPQPKQEEFLQQSADIVIFGGSAGGGKTWGLLLEPLHHRHVPGFTCVIFRRTYPQINNPGGMWDESIQVYPKLRAVPSRGNMEWKFPAGASLAFRHMDQPEIDYQGAQICLIEFDQLEEFTEHQFFFMLSRNRSACGVRPYIRATANPQPGWLADFLSWWIAPDGYADMSRVGKVRWFVRYGGELKWSDSAEGLAEFKDSDGTPIQPKSVTFIPSSVYDNPIMLKQNPGYLASLMALQETERQRLLGDKVRGGNWKVKPGGSSFKRHWFKILPATEVPAKFDCLLRYWDMAATVESAKTPDPDWTAGVKIGYVANGNAFYVLDLRHERMTPAQSEEMISNTALQDGFDCFVRQEEEGGSSGKTQTYNYASRVLRGFNFRGCHQSDSKIMRANPVSAAAEHGFIYLVEAPWNAAFLDECESFGPDCPHDDIVDALSGAYNEICKTFIRPGVGGNGYPAGTGMAIDKADEEIQTLLLQIKNGSPEDLVEADRIMREGGLR